MSARSAAKVTVVSAPAELLAAFGSKVSAARLAVFVIEPSLWGRTAISTVALAPLAIVARSQVTVPLDCEQLPCEGVADSNVTPAGRLSVSSTPVAADGPEFSAVSV